MSNRTDPEFRKHVFRIATHHPRRIVYRNTQTYMWMIEDSLRPAVMYSGIARSAHLVNLLWESALDPMIARQEFLALSSLDIPFFSRSASSSSHLRSTIELKADETIAGLPAQLQLLTSALSGNLTVGNR